jgi:hypothetical protein
MSAELDQIALVTMAANLNAHTVREQQKENARLRGVIAKLQASRKAMKAKLDKATKTMARARAKGKRR